MIKVVTLYQTSRGFFKTREEASKKKNRKLVTRDRWGPQERERIHKVRALKTFSPEEKIEYFILEKIEVT